MRLAPRPAEMRPPAVAMRGERGCVCVSASLPRAGRERRQSEAEKKSLFSLFVHSHFAGTRRAARASPHIASTPPLATRPCHLQDHPLFLRAAWWRHTRPGRPSQARQPRPFRRRRPDLNLVPSHHHHRCRRPAPNPASSTLTPCGGATVRHGEESWRGPLPARAAGPLTLSPSPLPLPPLSISEPAPGHQLRQFYRHGDVDDCSSSWKDLWDCLSARTVRFKEDADAAAAAAAAARATHPLWRLRTPDEAAVWWAAEFGHVGQGGAEQQHPRAGGGGGGGVHASGGEATP